ncbi:MAG: phage holin family protein [Acaryochloridaceae cyanobacterium RL_2_7]|nr:phage holin family protein [Acaryochloridaceae cyanobacterium RL_2_7]
MKRFFLTLIISAASLLITAYLIDGFDVSGVQEAAMAATALGIVNATIRPILSFLTFPIRLITLNTFTFVINALMLWGVSLLITPGFTIQGPIPAFIGSLVLTVVSGLLNLLLNPKKR